MNRKNQSKKQTPKSPWGQIRLGSFRAEFPQPRIPRLLGAAVRLPSGISVYPSVNLDVPIIPLAVNVAAGALAAVNPMDTTAMNAFAARFGVVFNEYAIVGANLEVRVTDVTNPAGIAAVFLDEESNATPTSAQALNRPRLDILLNQQTTPQPYRISWVPRDLLDLDYVPTGTNFTPVFLKTFASSATGTTGSTTAQILITGSLALCFRGYA